MNDVRPDYFRPTTPVEELLRQSKGNFRRETILNAIAEEGLEAIPEQWLEAELSFEQTMMLVRMNPQLTGGEDLPDMLEGEVEIARQSLVDSVHGEVKSLRARPADDGGILLRIVDEWEEWINFGWVLEQEHFPGPLTAEEVLRVFRNCTPCACEKMCTQRFSSDFYPNLDELADELGVKVLWVDERPEEATDSG
jgi:hypothetical protein